MRRRQEVNVRVSGSGYESCFLFSFCSFSFPNDPCSSPVSMSSWFILVVEFLSLPVSSSLNTDLCIYLFFVFTALLFVFTVWFFCVFIVPSSFWSSHSLMKQQSVLVLFSLMPSCSDKSHRRIISEIFYL